MTHTKDEMDSTSNSAVWEELAGAETAAQTSPAPIRHEPQRTLPPGTPETWAAELDARAQAFEAEGKQRVLADYLRRLAIFLREDEALWQVIQILEEDLHNHEMGVKIAIERNDEAKEALYRACSTTVKNLLANYKALQASQPRP